jgi:hypothetical protein
MMAAFFFLIALISLIIRLAMGVEWPTLVRFVVGCSAQ